MPGVCNGTDIKACPHPLLLPPQEHIRIRCCRRSILHPLPPHIRVRCCRRRSIHPLRKEHPHPLLAAATTIHNYNGSIHPRIQNLKQHIYCTLLVGLYYIIWDKAGIVCSYCHLFSHKL